MTSEVVEEIAEAVGFVAVLSVGWIALGRDFVDRRRGQRRARKRARQAEAAAFEASWETEAFAPEAIRTAVRTLLEVATESWHGPARLGSKDQVVIQRWARTHRLGEHTVLVGAPVVDLLRVVNRESESEDRVVVRIRATLQPASAPSSQGSRKTDIDERWTLARRGRSWALMEFDDMPLAEELLNRPLIAGVWADQERLTERSLVEIAQHTPASVEVRPADLADRDLDPIHQLLDLSVITAGTYQPSWRRRLFT